MQQPTCFKEIKEKAINVEIFFHKKYLTRVIWTNFIKLETCVYVFVCVCVCLYVCVCVCVCVCVRERYPTAVHPGTTVVGAEL